MNAEKIVLIIQVVLLTLMTIMVLYHLIEIVKRDRQIRKTAKAVEKKIDDAIVECIMKDNNKIKKATTQEKNNYNNMSVTELKKIAQTKKIKGYYNLHKEELIKALEETETLQK